MLRGRNHVGRALLVPLALLALSAAVAAASLPASAASSATVVGATVPSATNLDTSACDSRTVAEGTELGTVLPGSIGASAGDCSITFGSSNDTSMLRMAQADGAGRAMVSSLDGQLVSTFGTAGVRTFSAPATPDDGQNMALQSDGKLVLVGRGGAFNMQVMRLNADGSTDTTFSGDGHHEIDLGGDDQPNAVAIAANGDILIGGSSNASGNWRWFVRRINPTTGAGVASFGTAGTWWFNPTANIDVVNELYVLDDGSILGAAATNASIISEEDTFSGRFAAFLLDGATGTLVPGWGTNGGWTNGPNPGAWITADAARLDDGSLVMIGNSWGPAANIQSVHLFANGTVDTAWDGGATIGEFDLGGEDWARGVTAAADGSVYITGYTDAGSATGDVFIARLTAGGALDTSWGGGDGISVLANHGTDANDDASAIVLHPAGRILSFGWMNPTGGGSDEDVAASSHLLDGTLDTGFDGNGLWSRDVGGSAMFYDAMIGPDGTVYASGTNGTDPVIVAFSAATAPDYDADGEDDVAGNADDDDFTTAGASLFGACLRAVSGAGVGGTWTVDPGGDCATTDADAWNRVAATTASAGGKVAQSPTATTQNANVRIRFALRTAAAQRPGTYVAPITIEVVAPNA